MNSLIVESFVARKFGKVNPLIAKMSISGDELYNTKSTK